LCGRSPGRTHVKCFATTRLAQLSYAA